MDHTVLLFGESRTQYWHEFIVLRDIEIASNRVAQIVLLGERSH